MVGFDCCETEGRCSNRPYKESLRSSVWSILTLHLHLLSLVFLQSLISTFSRSGILYTSFSISIHTVHLSKCCYSSLHTLHIPLGQRCSNQQSSSKIFDIILIQKPCISQASSFPSLSPSLRPARPMCPRNHSPPACSTLGKTSNAAQISTQKLRAERDLTTAIMAGAAGEEYPLFPHYPQTFKSQRVQHDIHHQYQHA
jgi:hypothetical protein